MIRATLIITGEVQEAGYRALVIKLARKFRLEGTIENLPDGTVKVVCEGKKEDIEKLIESIKVKTETIEVEDIDVKYEELVGEFKGKGFIVKIEESFKGLGQEIFQGYATASKYFKVGWDKQDETLKAIKDMHRDTNRRFDIMAERYDLIAKALVKGLTKIDDGFARMECEFIKSRKETREEFVKSRKESAKAYNNLARAINNLTKSLKTRNR